MVPITTVVRKHRSPLIRQSPHTTIPTVRPNVTSVDTIIDALPRPDHYTGSGGTPSVVDVFGGLGETLGTPTGLQSYIDAIHAQATTIYGNDPVLDP